MRPFVFALLLLAFACTPPASRETFIPGEGPYVFTVEMAEQCAYDFDLFTRIDATEYPSRLRLDIGWKSPDDSLFRETVYLPVTRGRSFFDQEAYAPYRSGVVPAVPGTWTVTVTVPQAPEGLRGMGLVTRRYPEKQ